MHIAFWENSETAYFNLASRHGAFGIDDYGNEGLLILLVKCLGADINTGEPAAIARMRVIPTANILGSRYLFASTQMHTNEFISFTASVHTRLSTFNWESKAIHNVKCIYDKLD